METATVLPDRGKFSLKSLVPWAGGFVLGAGVGILLCWLLIVQPVNELMRKSAALKPAGDARISLVLLEYLRAGDTQRVIDVLQMQLDGQIARLGLELGVVDAFPKTAFDHDSVAYIQVTLQRAVTYFEKYPRTPRSDPAFALSEQAIAKALAAAARKDGSKDAP